MVTMDVFVSYSTPDKVVADATIAALESSQIRCWYAPRDIPPGKLYGEAIIEALRASRILVVIVSSRSLESPHVLRELERGVHYGLVVVPLRIEDIPMKGAFELFLSAPHWLDAITPPLEVHLRRLQQTVATILAGDAPPAQKVVEVKAPTSAAPETAKVEELPPDLWTRTGRSRIREFFSRLTDDPEV
jgi:hypothetical protein